MATLLFLNRRSQFRFLPWALGKCNWGEGEKDRPATPKPPLTAPREPGTRDGAGRAPGPAPRPAGPHPNGEAKGEGGGAHELCWLPGKESGVRSMANKQCPNHPLDYCLLARESRR